MIPNSLHPMLTNPAIVLAACAVLAPLLAAGFFGRRVAWVRGLPLAWRVVLPGLLCLPYALVAGAEGKFRWGWFALYALMPVAVCALLAWARRADAAQRGWWQDYLVLAALGLAVDLHWLEPAWPPRLAVFSKIMLLDLGIWGFFAIRGLAGIGFDLRVRGADLRNGLRELAFYTPIALALGLALGFLHVHAAWPSPVRLVGGFVLTFFFVAVPEELFFRGWMQNLLERRLGRGPALLVTSALFGLSHFNKRAAHFNWRYVLLAAIAGIFYGRAWRAERRVASSAVTHACVDTLWSAWLR